MTSSQDYGQTYPAQIGSDVTPIIFGQFPRRFTFRSRPNNVIMRYIHHMQQLEPVPAAYRPLPSRPTHPIELSNKHRPDSLDCVVRQPQALQKHYDTRQIHKSRVITRGATMVWQHFATPASACMTQEEELRPRPKEESTACTDSKHVKIGWCRFDKTLTE